MPHVDPSRVRFDSAIQTLRAHGRRLTSLKRTVLEQFAGTDCALTVEDIGARVGVSSDLSPLYRCLASMEEAGVLTHLYLADRVRRYELADEFGGHHHHHHVCVQCSGVTRIEGCGLTESMDDRAAAAGCVVQDHVVVLKGICSRCASTR
ncbi:MAG: transcriptional repressor [Actinobacteria bacterium]|nr:transcriptional repressor [Actinomycetota bacterium]